MKTKKATKLIFTSYQAPTASVQNVYTPLQFNSFGLHTVKSTAINTAYEDGVRLAVLHFNVPMSLNCFTTSWS
jgi:hypothetical protein